MRLDSVIFTGCGGEEAGEPGDGDGDGDGSLADITDIERRGPGCFSKSGIILPYEVGSLMV